MNWDTESVEVEIEIKGGFPELEGDKSDLTNSARPRLTPWSWAISSIAFLEALTNISAQLLFAVGLNKLIQSVLNIDFGILLNDFWRALLLVEWTFEEYLGLTLGLMGFASFFTALRFSGTYRLSKAVARKIRSRVARAVLQGSGDLPFEKLMEITQYTERIESYVAEVRYVRQYNFAVLFIGFVFIAIVAIEVAAIIFGMAVLLVVFGVIFQKIGLRRKREQISITEGELKDLLIDIVSMKNVVILNDQSDHEIGAIERLDGQSAPLVAEASGIVFIALFIRTLLNTYAVPLILVYTFYTAADANSLFAFLTALLCATQLYTSIAVLINVEHRMPYFRVAISVIEKFIDTEDLRFIFKKTDLVDGDKHAVAKTRIGTTFEEDLSDDDETDLVRFQNVELVYPLGNGSNLTVLHDLSFTLKAGKSVGIVGETGSGKSTLLNLLLGFIRPSAGKIFVEGTEMRYDQASLIQWRKRIALVSQDSPMFKRSIRENLTYGSDDTPQEAFEKAIEEACLGEWLDSLEDGANTVLELREKQLSGGQRQRIQLCRCFLGSQEILLLDEPTSSLDPTTRARITTNLERFFRGKTAVVITHDESMLPIFDEVYRLSREDGLVKVETLES